MHTNVYRGALFAGLFALAYAFVAQPGALQAKPADNLQVLPKTTDKKAVKKVMKEMAKSLGVQCDYCHDIDDMAKDTPHKEEARAMMRMVNETNKKYFKAKPRISCMTCHNGAKEPK